MKTTYLKSFRLVYLALVMLSLKYSVNKDNISEIFRLAPLAIGMQQQKIENNGIFPKFSAYLARTCHVINNCHFIDKIFSKQRQHFKNMSACSARHWNPTTTKKNEKEMAHFQNF